MLHSLLFLTILLPVDGILIGCISNVTFNSQSSLTVVHYNVTQAECFCRTFVNNCTGCNYFHDQNICEIFENFTTNYTLNSTRYSRFCFTTTPPTPIEVLATTTTTTTTTTQSTARSPLRWNSTGVTVISGVLNGTPFEPHSVFVDADYFIYVAEKDNERVTKWASQPYDRTTTLVLTTANGQLSSPISLYVDPVSRDIYVANDGNRRVKHFLNGSTSGNDVPGNFGGFTPSLTGVYLTTNGSIYVSDFGGHRVYDWVTNRVVAGGNGQGSGLHQLNGPRRFIIHQDNFFYVSEAYNHRVTRWEIGGTNGTVVAGIGIAGVNQNQFNSPCGVVVSSRGDVIVCDYGNNRIQRWNASSSTGETIAGQANGSPGNQTNRLREPRAIAIDKDDNIYVADNGNFRVQRFNVL